MHGSTALGCLPLILNIEQELVLTPRITHATEIEHGFSRCTLPSLERSTLGSNFAFISQAMFHLVELSYIDDLSVIINVLAIYTSYFILLYG